MKSRSVVHCFCLVFVQISITVHASSNEEDIIYTIGMLRDRLNENGANINGVLQILPDSFIDEGRYGSVYSGIRINDSRPVAVKFVEGGYKASARREYTMYSYLHAIDDATVERYGIPAVFYYAEWKGFIVMAITLCKESLSYRKADLLVPLNALIIFQQFVRTCRYLHSHGIRHDDVKPDNIMTRSFQTFLIDYNLGSKMNDDTNLCTSEYMPRRMHFTDRNRMAIDDFESFFYGMANICEVPLKWFKYKNFSERGMERKYGEAKRDTKDIKNQIESICSQPLQEVFMAFFLEIFSKDDKEFPNYDRLDKFISAQIKDVLTPDQPNFFTWMKRQDIEEAIEHIKRNPIPNITDITDPRKFNFIYPRVNVNYFNASSGTGSSKHP